MVYCITWILYFLTNITLITYFKLFCTDILSLSIRSSKTGVVLGVLNSDRLIFGFHENRPYWYYISIVPISRFWYKSIYRRKKFTTNFNSFRYWYQYLTLIYRVWNINVYWYIILNFRFDVSKFRYIAIIAVLYLDVSVDTGGVWQPLPIEGEDLVMQRSRHWRSVIVFVMMGYLLRNLSILPPVQPHKGRLNTLLLIFYVFLWHYRTSLQLI